MESVRHLWYPRAIPPPFQAFPHLVWNALAELTKNPIAGHFWVA